MIRMWTIYRDPKDHPGQYVVREFIVTANGPNPIPKPFTAPSLDLARLAIPDGAYNLGRKPEDDPVIVETWI